MVLTKSDIGERVDSLAGQAMRTASSLAMLARITANSSLDSYATRFSTIALKLQGLSMDIEKEINGEQEAKKGNGSKS